MREGLHRLRHRRLLLLAVLAAAAFFRLFGLSQTGISGVDEGRYVLDAFSKYVELRWCAKLVSAKFDEQAGGDELLLADALPKAQSELSRYHPFLPKMGFSYLVALLWMASGFSLMLSNGVEAVAGVLTVAATYGLVRSGRSARAGLMAAAFLALSPYHIYFSRNSYPQCVSGLLLVLAVWSHLAWWRGLGQQEAGGTPGRHGWAAAGCGILAGLSFWFNYQVGAALPLLLAVHGLICFKGVSIGVGLRRFIVGGLLVGGGFAAVIMAAEMMSYPMILAFRSQGLRYPHGTFLELLAPRFTSHSSLPLHPSGLALFPYFLSLYHGAAGAVAIVVLAVLGAWLAARRWRAGQGHGGPPPLYPQIIYFAIPFLVPALLYSVKTTQGARMFVYVLPFLAGMIGAVVDAAWTEPGRARRAVRGVVTAALAVAAISASPRIVEVLRMRSAYPEVMAFAKEATGAAPEAAWTSVLGAYRIECGLEEPGLDTQEKALPYFIADVQELYDGRYPDESPSVPAGFEPVDTFHHQFGRLFLESEVFPMFGNAIDNIRYVRALDLDRARAIIVYGAPNLPPAQAKDAGDSQQR